MCSTQQLNDNLAVHALPHVISENLSPGYNALQVPAIGYNQQVSMGRVRQIHSSVKYDFHVTT